MRTRRTRRTRKTKTKRKGGTHTPPMEITMTTPIFSLEDLFRILWEVSSGIPSYSVEVTSENNPPEQMPVMDAVAMLAATDILPGSNSHVIDDRLTKEMVIEAMTKVGYEEHAFPKYEEFSMGLVRR